MRVCTIDDPFVQVCNRSNYDIVFISRCRKFRRTDQEVDITSEFGTISTQTAVTENGELYNLLPLLGSDFNSRHLGIPETLGRGDEEEECLQREVRWWNQETAGFDTKQRFLCRRVTWSHVVLVDLS